MLANGLQSILEAGGVSVEGVQTYGELYDPRLVIPLAHFFTTDDVDDLALAAQEHIEANKFGAPNVRPVVYDAFSELAYNAVHHANSPLGAFGMVQYYDFEEGGARFICVVADGGVGIRESLSNNPDILPRLTSDRTAIHLAVSERISGTGDPQRGLGLPYVSGKTRVPRGQLILHSGLGMLNMRGVDTYVLGEATLFPGTLVFAAIPT